MPLLMYSELNRISTWKKCSWDESHGTSMVNSDGNIIDFDRVKRDYLNNLQKSEECAKSVDALGEDKYNHVYMVEFKNGEFNEAEIREKLTESVLIYGDISHTSLKRMRDNLTFILVYNPEYKKFKNVEQRAIYQARIGKASCPIYGLDKYAGFCCARAYMMTGAEFEEKMVGEISVL